MPDAATDRMAFSTVNDRGAISRGGGIQTAVGSTTVRKSGATARGRHRHSPPAAQNAKPELILEDAVPVRYVAVRRAFGASARVLRSVRP